MLVLFVVMINEPLHQKTNNLHKLCENKDADQLCSDQHLCFRHMDSIIPLLLISKVSSF